MPLALMMKGCAASWATSKYACRIEGQFGIAAPPLVGVVARDAPAAYHVLERLPAEGTPVGFQSPVEQVVGLGKCHPVIQVAHTLGEIVGLMCGLEVAAHQEGTVAVGVFFHPLDGLDGDDVGGEASHPETGVDMPRSRPVAVYEGGVAVLSLVVEDGVVVESLRLGAQVPLAHEDVL